MTPIATNSILAELEKLERDQDEKHKRVKELTEKRNAWDAELLAKRAQLSSFHTPDQRGRYTLTEAGAEERKLTKEVKALMAAGNPYEDERQKAQGLFHEAERACLRFKVLNAREVVDGVAPDREKVAGELEAAIEQVNQAMDAYRMCEGAVMQAVGIVGLPGRDVLVDNRVAQLASLINSLDFDDIAPPHSRTLHSDAEHQPFRPSDDGTGWV